MQVLIIGGTGLISTGITRTLIAGGHDVACFTRGQRDVSLPDAVSFHEGDRNESEDLERTVERVDPDVVIDMVCFDPEQASAAVECCAGRIDQYVFCSTVDVYHRPVARAPITEAAPRSPPVSDYGAGKAAAEDVFMDAHGDAFATTIIRPWSTYGEGGTINHTFGNDTYYLDRIRQGKPIVVHGDGTSMWAACHRDDVAVAFANAVGNPAAYGEAYHVTSEEHMTWNQYHRTVARAIDAPAPTFVHIPTTLLRAIAPERTGMLEAHFQYSTVFDNAKARRDLGFQYTIPLEEGVRRTVAHLERTAGIDDWDSTNDDHIIAAWQEATDVFVDQFD